LVSMSPDNPPGTRPNDKISLSGAGRPHQLAVSTRRRSQLLLCRPATAFPTIVSLWTNFALQ
jgi:hypothetical protein